MVSIKAKHAVKERQTDSECSGVGEWGERFGRVRHSNLNSALDRWSEPVWRCGKALGW